MTEIASSSVDDYLEISDDELEMEESAPKKSKASIDSRRRLENRIAERMLERDIQEFDFRI